MNIKAFQLSMKSATTIAVSAILVASVGGAAWSSGPGTGTAPVREQNLDDSGAIKVHEQGTANVNVTNSSVPVTVGNFPATQQVAGTVDIGNLPNTQQVAGTVNVGNLPATQNVNVVGGTLQTSGAVMNAAFESGLLSLDKTSGQTITLDKPIYATTISINELDKEDASFNFKATVAGSACGFCDVLYLEPDGPEVWSFSTPILIEQINVFCYDPSTFVDECLPQIFIAGLKA